jgi:hypothetical protein
MTSIMPAKGVTPHMRGLSGSRFNMTGHRTGILCEEITRKVEPCHGTLLWNICRAVGSPRSCMCCAIQLWLGLVVVLATPTLILGTIWVIQSNAPAPADLFMQSVVQRDGGLGWHQLCPALQAQVPLAVLASQVQQQRSAEARQGLTLTLDYIGAHAQPQGGEIRLYVVTACRPHGWVELRMYIVYMQASGCVEDVENH